MLCAYLTSQSHRLSSSIQAPELVLLGKEGKGKTMLVEAIIGLPGFVKQGGKCT